MHTKCRNRRPQTSDADTGLLRQTSAPAVAYRRSLDSYLIYTDPCCGCTAGATLGVEIASDTDLAPLFNVNVLSKSSPLFLSIGFPETQ